MPFLKAEERELINTFWTLCQEVPVYPCDMNRYVSLALPLAIVRLPRLRLHKVEGWLQKRGVAVSLGERQRNIRGGLIAFGGQGLIFLEGTDTENEQRFTLAHEAAHFMRHHWLPRERMIDKVGTEIVDVLDGIREPSLTERLQAALQNQTFGLYSNFLDPREASDLPDGLRATVENEADRIAMALLAPSETVLNAVNVSASSYEDTVLTLSHLLQADYGFPFYPAEVYARALTSGTGKKRKSWRYMLES